MNAWFADTSFFIAMLSRRDLFHARAVTLSRRICKAVTTHWVLVELANHFADTSLREAAAALIAGVETDRRFQVLPATAEQFREGFQSYTERPDKEWSLTDCISFLVMQEHGLSEAMTTDHHYHQAGFRVLLH